MQPMYTRGFIRCRAKVIPSVAVINTRQMNTIIPIKQKRLKNVMLESNDHTVDQKTHWTRSIMAVKLVR